MRYICVKPTHYGATLLIVLFAVGISSCGDGSHSLPDDPAMLQYSFSHASLPGTDVLTFTAGDFDGDGIDEGVCFAENPDGDRHIAVLRPREGQHSAVQQINVPFRSFLMGLTDLTGDGLPELVWWQQDGGAEVTFVFEELVVGAEETIRKELGTVVWDATGSLAETNGRWGGSAALIGAFDLDGNGTKESVAVAVSTGLRLSPRGVWLVNWESGAIVWRLSTGATPTGTATITDVEGDGTEEIIIGVESPSNGVQAGDWDDSHAYVIVLDLHGKALWSRELGGFSTRVDLAVGDADGDGAIEVFTVLAGTGDQVTIDNALRAWRAADGESLASVPFGCPANSVDLMETDDGMRILVGLADGSVRRYAFSDGGFVEDALIECDEPVAVARYVDFGPPPGRPGVMVKTVLGTFAALDLDLRPMAVLRTEESIIASHDRITELVLPLEGEPEHGVMTQTSETIYFLHLERGLPPWLKHLLSLLKPIAGIAFVLGVPALVPSWRRTTLAALRRRLIPRKMRGAALDDLLTELRTGGHGKLTATSTFRRVREQLTMLSYYDSDPPEVFSKRFAEAVGNAREIGLPTVDSIAGEGARLGLAPEPMARLAASLTEARSVIAGLSVDIPATSDALVLQRRLTDSLPVVDEGLSAVKHAAELERSSQVGLELGRVLSSRHVELARPGLTFIGSDIGSIGRVDVVGTSQELTFIFDNLIGNALRAVTDCEAATIRVDVAIANGRATVVVEDSGAGVPSEMCDEIFREGVSDRDGGGHGLARSRELLEQRGGSIRLLESAPGKGAVFEVSLRVVS